MSREQLQLVWQHVINHGRRMFNTRNRGILQLSDPYSELFCYNFSLKFRLQVD